MAAAGHDVFLTPVGERVLVHAPLHGVTALVNRAAARALRVALERASASSIPERVRPLAERLLAPPALRPAPRDGPFAPRHLSLLLTSECNLRCLYCAPAAGDGERLTMPRRVCVAALDHFAEIAERDRLPAYTLYFFGGEPFLRWDLLRTCIGEAERRADRLGIPLHATATTNAYLSPAQAAWLARRFVFAIVSMDGPQAMHDRFRPTAGGEGSYRVVERAVEEFQAGGLRFALRCSVPGGAEARIPEIAEFFCRRFQPSVVNFEPLVPSGRCAESGLEPPDPDAFARGVMGAGPVLGAHGVGLMLTTARTRRVARSNCEVANDEFVVTPDGLVAACFGANHHSSEHAESFAIGAFDEGSGRLRIEPRRLDAVRRFGVETIPRCRDCFCKWHCSGGCRIFHTPPFCEEPPGPMCRLTRKLTLWKLLWDLGFEREADALREQD